MKKTKLTMAVLALGLLIAAAACKKDDNKEDNNTSIYPKTLTYKGYEVKEFKMYVGSPDGGKEMNTTGIDPKTYWKSYIENKNNEYIGDDYKFLSETEITSSTINKTYQYKFENGELYIFRENKWEKLSAYGDITNLHVKSSCYIANRSGGMGSIGQNGGEYTSLTELMGRVGFSSLSDMKSTSDTIMWCNMNYIWK